MLGLYNQGFLISKVHYGSSGSTEGAIIIRIGFWRLYSTLIIMRNPKLRLMNPALPTIRNIQYNSHSLGSLR